MLNNNNKLIFFKGKDLLTIVLLLAVCLIPVVYKEAFSEEGISVSRISASLVFPCGMYQEEMGVCRSIEHLDDGFFL